MIVVVGLVIAFVVMLFLYNPATRNCRWREHRKDGQSTWRCIQCGAETIGPIGEKPTECFQNRS